MKLSLIRNIILILSVFVIGFGVGNRYGNYQLSLQLKNYRPQVQITRQDPPPAITNIDFSGFWDVWQKVSRKYVDQTKINSQKMVDGAISGMVAALGDPYTVYLPPEANKAAKEDLNGVSFDGIGAQLGLNGKNVVVIAPLAETPAEKAGIRAGDHIYKVNNEVVDGKSLPEVVAKIRGPKGSKVRLIVYRDGVKKPIAYDITRATIIVKTVTVLFIKDKNNNEFAHLKLSKFGDKTDDEWLAAVAQINERKQEIKGVILDLRNNPGGYLNGSVFVASEFLPQGTKIVTQHSSLEGDKIYNVNRKGSLLDTPLVVLINKGSASASEIVAGALKDNKRASLLGEKSFGKGSVQEAEDLTGGAGLHVTIAKWLMPGGQWINGRGIEPDISVKNDEKKLKEDKQLEKAMETLTNSSR